MKRFLIIILATLLCCGIKSVKGQTVSRCVQQFLDNCTLPIDSTTGNLPAYRVSNINIADSLTGTLPSSVLPVGSTFTIISDTFSADQITVKETALTDLVQGTWILVDVNVRYQTTNGLGSFDFSTSPLFQFSLSNDSTYHIQLDSNIIHKYFTGRGTFSIPTYSPAWQLVTFQKALASDSDLVSYPILQKPSDGSQQMALVNKNTVLYINNLRKGISDGSPKMLYIKILATFRKISLN